MTDVSHERAVTRSEIQSQIQHLQTVAIEASNQLRKQCAQVLQTQAIRLEGVTETEIEDIVGLDNSMDELLLCVLYTELRKEVREITDALVDQQYNLFSTRKRTVGMSPIRVEGDEIGDSLGTARRRGLALQVEESDDDNPPQLSGTDTFRTARGVPMFSSAESPVVVSSSEEPHSSHAVDASDANEQPMSAPAAPQKPDDPAGEVTKLEQRLYEVCIEIDEWRRTRLLLDFITEHNTGSGGRRRDSQPQSIRSVGIATRLPIEQIIGEARQRVRASSVGNASAAAAAGFRAPLRDAALTLSASPPLSRLMQAEREAESLRASHHAGNGCSSSPLCKPTFDGALSPSGQPYQGQLSSLRLIGDNVNGAINNGNSSGGRHRTLVDDVRIIGWVTRGSGLDVHTEFKVLVHLARGENLTVMRRYTDFALLREVLCQRYYTFRKRIPHLPPKKAFGKFEDRFLKERESGLQFFLAYVMLHPVIGCSSIVRQWLEGVPPPV
ncbi:hypothetical protein GGI13_003832 [Coemansia sp. RSA 455]|nr:hypothetical protein GGI14_002665 [Coemansia sp. S680]KAJ2038842.1 hypothetical protein H4S03_002079 [Coemansia sp. S3946]KAJ2048783.1 hypothetical protein GGI08_005906 [Coemansia sp. S2]KAJ2251456.1 hypothetical protein GGI13_003832 [Coemansia sp. RSA 455]